MLVFGILIILKILLFMNITGVSHNFISVFLITAGISLLIMGLIHNSKFKYKNILMLVFYSFLSLVMLVDIAHFVYFNSLPSVNMLSQAGQLTDVSNSVRDLLTFRNLLFVLDLPLVVLYSLKFYEGKRFTIRRDLRFKVLAGYLGALVAVFLVNMAMGNINAIRHQELYSFHFTDIKNALREEERQTIGDSSAFGQEDFQILRERTYLEPGKYTGIGEGRNLIVLQVEALQSFVIDLEYMGQEITPNINRLLNHESTLYYDNFYQLIGRGNTSDAEFVINNSLHPSMISPTYSQYYDNSFYGLPWILRDNGYNAWVFHGYKKEFWSRDKAYPNQGFQRFLSEEDFEFDPNDIIDLGIKDKDFLDQTLEYLKDLDGIDENPFYAFIVTLSSHNPYIMPEKYHVLEIEEKYEGTILGNYLQSIHYVDQAIGDFIEGLKAEGFYDNSVIAIYGDHFAIQSTSSEISQLMEDFLGHPYDFDTIMNIPLGIHVPGEELGETISKTASMIDFLPTILNIMGYQNERGLMLGRDINNFEGYNNVKPQTIMRKGSFIDDEVMFTIARTEIFEHSSAKRLDTGEALDIEDFREIYEDVLWEINISDFILKNDIIGYLMENQGDLDLDQIEYRGISKKEYIKKIEENTLEALSREYSRGNRLMTVEFSLEDVELYGEVHELSVLRHGDNLAILADFEEWDRLHPDAHLYMRTGEDNKEAVFEKLRYRYPRAQSQHIVEIDSFDEHYFITSHFFQNIMLNVSGSDYSDDEILSFLRVHSLFGVLVDDERAKSDLVDEIRALGQDVYVEKDKSIEQVATHSRDFSRE